MRRITTPHTTYAAPGTILELDDEYRVQSLGSVDLGPSTYQVRRLEMADKERDGVYVETYIVGPRGAIYMLRETTAAGVFQLVSVNSGKPMTRQGNEVLVVSIGNIFEETSRAKLRAAR